MNGIKFISLVFSIHKLVFKFLINFDGLYASGNTSRRVQNTRHQKHVWVVAEIIKTIHIIRIGKVFVFKLNEHLSYSFDEYLCRKFYYF